MLTHKVVMVIMLMGSDGTYSHGVVPYKDYDSCYASLKWTVDTDRYVHADRVCMSAAAYDKITLIKKPGHTGGSKLDWYPKD